MTVRIGALVVALTGAVGLMIALQGWQARGPDADVIGSMVRAAALADRGVIPQRGTLTDLNAFRRRARRGSPCRASCSSTIRGSSS